MTKQIEKNNILAFLLDSKFHIHRHLLLQFFILMITIGVFFDTPDKLNLSINRFYGWIGYFLVINLLIYINAYILVPNYLIKNKLFKYSIFVLLLIIISIFIIIILQEYFYDIGITHHEPNAIVIFFNIASSILSIGLVIIGISALLLFRNWITYNKKANELKSTTLETELKFLKSQINPHFLFNMLNNANIMVDEDPNLASQILIKLNDLLQYQIHDSTKDKVYLKEDISFLSDFLDLEKTRRDYFNYKISIGSDINNIQISPLLFIPFVENAVKHNSDSENLSYINIYFKIENNQLIFTCENSKPSKIIKRKDGGLGLANIKRRLDLLYPNNYSLEKKETEKTYTVYLILNL